MNWTMDYRRGRTPSLVGVGLLILAGSGAAQRISPHFSTVHVPYAAEVAISDKPASPVLGVQPRVPRTHWLEGGLVGGVALGIFGGLVGHALCTNSDVRQTCTGPTLGSAVLGAGVGFVTGALIGGQFPKRE